MSAKGFEARLNVTVAIVLLVTTGLILRGVELQLEDRDFLQREGDARYLREIVVPAHRGMLLDRRGEPLAISTPVHSVWAHPRELLRQRDRWVDLAEAMGVGTDYLTTLLESRADRSFVYLRRQVGPATAAAIDALSIDGVGLAREYRRYYPTGETTAHLLGFTNVDDRGQEGLELLFDESLNGVPGRKRVIKDRLRRTIADVETIRTPVPGTDIELSIDSRLQYAAYRELKVAMTGHEARAGSIVVIDARSGEVLALANQPPFNPNDRTQLKGERFRNRAVTDLMEPGSTTKPFTIAAALESGRFRPDSVISTGAGKFILGPHKITDVHGYGDLTVAQVLVKSSNVGSAKLAFAMDREPLWQLLARVGFGEAPTGVFPGEARGRLPHFRDWREIEHATIAFGYGFSASALQLARAYSVFANRGRLLPLSLRPLDASPTGQRVLSASTAEAVLAMLEAAVSDGTGKRANVAGYRVGGKTGTVHKTTAEGYAEDRHQSLFVGIVPVSKPRLIAAVIIDEPSRRGHFGGQVAAPVFARFMEDALRVLNVAPDDLSVVEHVAEAQQG